MVLPLTELQVLKKQSFNPQVLWSNWILQAFKPPNFRSLSFMFLSFDLSILKVPVLNPPFLGSSRIIGSYRATPPRPNPPQATPRQSSLPSWTPKSMHSASTLCQNPKMTPVFYRCFLTWCSPLPHGMHINFGDVHPSAAKRPILYSKTRFFCYLRAFCINCINNYNMQ